MVLERNLFSLFWWKDILELERNLILFVHAFAPDYIESISTFMSFLFCLNYT